MFLPETQESSDLGNNLVGLTIENKDSQLDTDSSQPVVVTISHDNIQVKQSSSSPLLYQLFPGLCQRAVLPVVVAPPPQLFRFWLHCVPG